MIFLLIGLLIIFVAIRNYKKGFYYFLFYKVCLVTNITVLSIPGIPLLTLDLFMTMVFLALYYKDKGKIHKEVLAFPYKKPFIWIAVIYFISTVFAYIGFVGAFSQYVGQMISEFAFAWLMWKIVDKNDFAYLLKGLSIMFFISCVYAFYEKFTHSNPIQQYEVTLVNDASRAIDFLVADDPNRGYRVQSYFEHAIGAGINWGMFIVMFFSFVVVYKLKINSRLALLTALLCVPCVFFANARGPLVFLFIGALSLVNLKNKRFYRLVVVCIVLLIVASPFLSDYIDNVLSIFDSKAQSEVGGSNAEMRFDQLDAALALMMQSPVWGLGYKFMNVFQNSLVHRLLGFESMWFTIFTQFGLLGFFVNVMLAYYSLIKIPRHYHSKPLFFFSLAYWVTASLTSVPGILMYLYYLIIILFIKMSRIYSKEKERFDYLYKYRK